MSLPIRLPYWVALFFACLLKIITIKMNDFEQSVPVQSRLNVQVNRCLAVFASRYKD